MLRAVEQIHFESPYSYYAVLYLLLEHIWITKHI